MSKLYIADSEDEDDADSSPLSPPPAILPHLANGQSSDPLSRGTDSTDTVFFRSVYHEQAEAAQERVRSVSKDVSAVKGTRASREDELWDVPSSPNPQLASSRRKRRKLSNDDADLSPQTRKDDESMASSMLPPTLQIDDEAAFVITPHAMTKSQQQGYVSVEHASSLGQDAGLASHGTAQRKLELALSSSGTNVNTPRTLDALTQASNAQEADLPAVNNNNAEDLPSSQPTMAAPPRRRRLSSPDVITIAEASGYQEDHYEPVEEDELALHGSAVPKDNGMEEYEEPAVIEDEDSPFEEEPVKPKKKRGRPKKAKAEAVVHEAEPPVEPAEKVKPGKKKRGRPRKEQATPRKAVDVEEHSSPKIEEGGQDAETSAMSTTAPDTAEDKTTTEAPSNEKMKAKAQNGMDEEKKSQLKAPNEADSNVQVEKAPKVERIKAPETGLKDDGKPVYRVGLSKRSRIAPLLKIIKK